MSSVWKHAGSSDPVMLHASGIGWYTVDGKYVITWFQGEQLPGQVFGAVGESGIESELDNYFEESRQDSYDESEGECD